jgi:acyl transferase domain-containing protein
VNNDGAARGAYTTPGLSGQAAVVSEALGNAGVDVESIGYVEAHGTGTILGDPIEVAALTRAFRARTAKRQFCALGSVKTNVGHLDVAAGITGLMKTALALRHRLIPPSLHFDEPNPEIDFEQSPFFVNTRLREWPANGTPRRAGVSSFGIGGTNAHVVLQEAPPAAPPAAAAPWQLLVLSARTPAALERATDDLVAHLRSDPAAVLADVAHTLQVGRRPFEHRRAVACDHAMDAVVALEARDSRRLAEGVVETAARPLVFVFPARGEGSADRARRLYEAEAVFRAEVDRAAEIARAHFGFDVRGLLYLGEPKPESQAGQALLFVFEWALARQWMAWGLRPEAFRGEGVGARVAACAAGAATLEESLARLAAGAPTAPRTEETRPEDVFLEVGPGSARAAESAVASFAPEDPAGLVGAVARLGAAGVAIDWTRLRAGERRRRVPLPTYPFERQRYWIDSQRVSA